MAELGLDPQAPELVAGLLLILAAIRSKTDLGVSPAKASAEYVRP